MIMSQETCLFVTPKPTRIGMCGMLDSLHYVFESTHTNISMSSWRCFLRFSYLVFLAGFYFPYAAKSKSGGKK
jgi:hypothetical protein